MERSEEVDGEVLLDGLKTAQIVVESDARVVNENVEGVDLAGRPLDLLNAGDIERQRGYAFIGESECAACSCIDPLRSSPERLIDERPADTAVGARDQNCLVFDVHTVLLFRAAIGLPDLASLLCKTGVVAKTHRCPATFFHPPEVLARMPISD